MQLSLFRKEKNKGKTMPAVTLCPGVTMIDEVSMGDVTPGQDALVKGISEALIVFGSIGGFLSCIGASYYVPVVALAYILLAAYFSYLFKSGKGWIRDTGYIVFFIVFVLGIKVFNRHINSGFYAILNIIYRIGSDYFDMSAVREFTEVIGNRPLTITIAVIFIGSVEILILNIYLSRYMSVMAAALMSIPLFVVPLFFEREPDSFYMILLFAGLASVIVQKGSGHYTRNKTNTQFAYHGKKRRGAILYSQSGKAVAETIAHMVIICVLVISLCNVIYPKEGFTYRYKDSTLKAAIQDSVENVMLAGLESLFNFYGSTSGMSGGKLGGVGSIRSDYQPDLKVTFTPYSYRTLYLKGFTGEYYVADHWTKDDDGVIATPTDSEAQGLLEVRNVGADHHYLYMPYYTQQDADTISRYQDNLGVSMWETEVYTYYPMIDTQSAKDSLTFAEEEIKSSYLNVPVGNYSVIENFCKDLGVSESDGPRQIIDKVTAYFQANIPYTLRPGAMPKNGDFVNYFLGKNRKGYCAHFASAATLIFRYYGIPARYVEGYALDYLAITDGELVEGKKYSDYYKGPSELGETAVVEVTATDANAHAWVEVYIDGRWQVAEVTPASSEEENEDFWTAFGRWLAPDETVEDSVQEGDENAFSMDRLGWIWRVVLWAIGAFLMFVIVRFAWRKGRRVMSYHKKDEVENVVAYYKYMCECMRAVEPGFYQADSHQAQLAYMMPEMDLTERRRLAKQLEQISYSSNVQGIDTKMLLSELKEAFRLRVRSYKPAKRLSLFLHL